MIIIIIIIMIIIIIIITFIYIALNQKLLLALYNITNKKKSTIIYNSAEIKYFSICKTFQP